MANCRRNQKKLYIPIDIPIVALKTIATDLFVFNDKTYILIVDLFSCFPVVRQLSGENKKTINVFADFGMPETIISDNGPCYKSQEFTISVQGSRLIISLKPRTIIKQILLQSI